MKKKICGMAGLMAMYIGHAFYSTKQFSFTRYKVKSNKIPNSFHGKQFIQISDLHSASFGRFNNRLIKAIQEQNPAGIFITGDLIDGDESLHVAISLVRKLSLICPIFYIAGNHEARSSFFEELVIELEKTGVHILNQSHTYITEANEKIAISGVFDPKFLYYGTLREDEKEHEQKDLEIDFLKQEIEAATGDIPENIFNILLAHRPEHWPLYKQYHADLTLVGHAHGGQIRLPFTKGIFAPGQGFFPKLTSGHYQDCGKQIIISRGLGNSSVFVPRVNNRPELIFITLEKSKERTKPSHNTVSQKISL